MQPRPHDKQSLLHKSYLVHIFLGESKKFLIDPLNVYGITTCTERKQVKVSRFFFEWKTC